MGAAPHQAAQGLDKGVKRVQGRAEEHLAAQFGEHLAISDADFLERLQTVSREADGADDDFLLALCRQITQGAIGGGFEPGHRSELALEAQRRAIFRPAELFIDQSDRLADMGFVGIAIPNVRLGQGVCGVEQESIARIEIASHCLLMDEPGLSLDVTRIVVPEVADLDVEGMVVFSEPFIEQRQRGAGGWTAVLGIHGDDDQVRDAAFDDTFHHTGDGGVAISHGGIDTPVAR